MYLYTLIIIFQKKKQELKDLISSSSIWQVTIDNYNNNKKTH